MKILIFTASAGNGHNSAANRIKETFLNHNKDTEIKIVDCYKKFASPLKNWIQTKGYLWICNHGVGLYNHFFKKSETDDFSHPERCSVIKSTKSLQKGILKEILDFKPDLVISTYIYCSVPLSIVKEKYRLKIKTASLMLDYGISPYWECIAKNTDYMFLTNDEVIEEFIKRGFQKENLFPTGIPISNIFSNLPLKVESRKQLNLDNNLFTLLIMKSGFFSLSEKEIMENLSKVNEKIQVVIINGTSNKSKNKLDKLIKKYNLKHKIINLGFTNEIPLYFSACDLVLGKAGGLTTTETITACLPSLIVGKLPQQEVYNKQFMVKNGCAKSVDKNNLFSTINEILSNNSLLENMREACQKTRITYSCEKMYNILKDVK